MGEPSKRAQYTAGAAAGIAGKLVSLAAGLAGLWLLNRILHREQYGAYAFTMAALQLVALAATAGLDRSLLFRLSREPERPGDAVGDAQVAWAIRAVLVVGIATGAAAAWGATLLTPRDDLPGVAVWFAALCAVVPLSAAAQIFVAWHQARKRFGAALLLPRLTEVARALLLLLALLVHPTPGAVALAVVAATAVPIVAWVRLAPAGTLSRAVRLPAGDIRYGLKLMLTALADRGVRRLDLLMIGILAGGVATAEYSVAAQLVALTLLGNELLGPVFTPRMGRYFALGDSAALAAEYGQNRLLTLVFGLAAAVFFVFLGRPLVGLFGDYEGAWPVLLILTAAFLIKVGFGATGRYLNMSGRAGWALGSTVVLLVAMALFNLVLIPMLGARGAALGTAISFATVNTLHSTVIWRQDRFPTVNVPVLALLSLTAALLLGAAFERIGAVPAGIGLTGLWLITAIRSWPIARNLLRARN